MLASACANDPPPAPPAPVAGASETVRSSYVLAPGDRLRITVFSEDRLSGEFGVTTTGQISFPLIGNLDVAGKTLADVQSMIRTRLADGYVNDPRVTAEFVTFRPFFVLGEVARPGQFPYADGLTLRQAIASAGGFTYRAKRDRVFIQLPGDTKEYTVDLEAESNRLVKPGEIIRVGERFF
nr:polysaccharide biosynthesis/export family protein [Sphingomonas guangdongensis]